VTICRVSNTASICLAVAALLAAWAVGGCSAPRGSAQPLAAPSATQAPAGHEPRPGESLSAVDLEGAGQPNAWRYSRPGASGAPELVRVELDLDRDGRTDVWEEYAAGQLVRRAYDLDGDGRPDLVLVFEGRALVRKEDALDDGGRAHAWALYRDGRLLRRERDTDAGDRGEASEPAQPPVPDPQK
jgi:hypothetical protein